MLDDINHHEGERGTAAMELRRQCSGDGAWDVAVWRQLGGSSEGDGGNGWNGCGLEAVAKAMEAMAGGCEMEGAGMEGVSAMEVARWRQRRWRQQRWQPQWRQQRMEAAVMEKRRSGVEP